MGLGRALGASSRLQERFKSAQDAIFGVLGAPRGGLERSGCDFGRLKSAQDAIFGVLGAPRRDLDASGWDFGAFWRLREA